MFLYNNENVCVWKQPCSHILFSLTYLFLGYPCHVQALLASLTYSWLICLACLVGILTCTLAEVGTNIYFFATGTVRVNMTASISVRVHVCLTCLLFGMLIFRSPLVCVGLAYIFWFLDPLIVWHVCYPVISVMYRSCRRILRNPDLFAWHV